MLPPFIKNKKILNELKINEVEGVNFNSKKIIFYEVEYNKNKYYFNNKKELFSFLNKHIKE